MFYVHLRGKSDISLYNVERLVVITETENVFCAVRTGPFNKKLRFIIKGLSNNSMRVCGHQSVARDVMHSGIRSGTCGFEVFRVSK